MRPLHKSRINLKGQYPPALLSPTRQHRGCIIAQILFCICSARLGIKQCNGLLQARAEELNAGLTGTASSRIGHDFSRIPIHSPAAGAIQTKLEINQPGDVYEQEADYVSEQVLRVPEPQLQRVCACGNNTTAGGECTNAVRSDWVCKPNSRLTSRGISTNGRPTGSPIR